MSANTQFWNESARDLRFYEQVLLLALHDEKGTLQRPSRRPRRRAGRLVDRGIVRVEEQSTLGLFSSTRYPEADPVPEDQLLARLREAIFTDSVDVDSRTCLLVSLANATNLLDRVFGAKKIRRKERIELLAGDESIGAATKRALDAFNASFFVTTVAVAG